MDFIYKKLIFTIIVLLILASITILSLNNTKLFSKAQKSTDKYKVAQQDEQNILNEYNSYIADNSRETISISKDELNSLVEEILNKKFTEQGISVPTGNIISQMGNEAPDGYLKCDGKEYNIKDYQNLANYFEKQFGSKNYFGGDGTTSFSVPNLQGEFLRGTGSNSHINQGNGENVGKHQDSTKHSYIQFSNAGIWGSTGISGNHDFEGNTTTGRFFGTTTSGDNQISYFISRPTNTSVLFCIKY